MTNMIDMFPTRPTEWSKPPVFAEPVKQSQDTDETIPHLEDQKTYFHRALLGRKLLVSIGDALRGLFGKRFSWFNRVETKSSKKLYLGMLPDDLVKRKIPERALFVSVLQDFETEHMDKKTKSFRVVVNSEDNVGMKPHEIDRGVAALHAAMKEQLDVPVYLHCKSGVGRSATVLAAYFMKYENMTLDQAIDRVQRDRPDAQLRGWFGRDNKHTKALREYSELKR